VQGYLQPEELAGDNKYFCSDCNSKQEASRGIVLSSLPPVLNIHLIRYVFDINTGSKKKVRHPATSLFHFTGLERG
jgi:ubiquitin C-terminal hydrolase